MANTNTNTISVNRFGVRDLSRNPIIDLIIRGAKARGLDPNAVLAVAQQEGLSGGIGDNGTSFGPFQLHRGGALPGSIPRGREQAWATSPAGINYALDAIARVAGGKRGAAAVDAIVRLFERPADPDGEVARAIKSLQGGGSPYPGPPVASAGLPGAGNVRSGLDPLLMGVLQSNGMPDIISSLLSTAPKPSQNLGAGAPSMGLGKAVLGAGADRPGVSTNPAVIRFVSQIAGLYGKPLTIGTGTNHNEFVKGTNRQSAHWTGNAADIPASGAALIKLGQDALIAAGMPPAQARKQRGGLYNIGGYQVIFATNTTGGNHWDHVHVGLRR